MPAMHPDPDQDPAVTYAGALEIDPAAFLAWLGFTADEPVVASLLDGGISAGALDPPVQSSASPSVSGGFRW